MKNKPCDDKSIDNDGFIAAGEDGKKSSANRYKRSTVLNAVAAVLLAAGFIVARMTSPIEGLSNLEAWLLVFLYAAGADAVVSFLKYLEYKKEENAGLEETSRRVDDDI